jgi:hypothetical protein
MCFILQVSINGGDCSGFGAHLNPRDKRILMVSAIGEVVVPASDGTTDHSRYSSRRTNDWVKKSCAQRETLTIAGFALDGTKWDGLYLGRRKAAT